MDMLPIKPIANNLIKATTGTANDGGSKSQSGYINVRTGDGGDELKLSDESKRLIGEDPVIEDDKSFLLNFLNKLKEFFVSLFKKVFALFNFKKSVEVKQETPKVSEVNNFLGYTKHTN